MAEAAWTPQRLNDCIARGEIRQLYLCYGDETFLIDESSRALQAAAVPEGMRDFNLNTFYAGETEVSKVIDAVETLPMMSTVRMVVVKDVQEFSEKEWEALLPLIERPVPSTALLLLANKIDKRKKHFKRLIENGVAVEFKRPFDNQIPDWIRSLSRRHGIQLTTDAMTLFHQFVGSNLTEIDAELGKLAVFLGDRKRADVEDILKSVSKLRVDSVFELTDAIGCNDRARALDCLVNLLDSGQNEVGVLALISRHVRLLKLVGDGLKDGMTGQRLSARAGISPYFLKSYVDQAKTWNDRRIERAFQVLLDTDRALKSSPVASHIWLENFILQACS